jgi:rubrerythrin/DNA-directed RNA polymerase subunit RPC12/RpoP
LLKKLNKFERMCKGVEKYKCIVCGAEINEKNFSLNGDAFDENNSKNKIIECPFCGVGLEFLSKGEEILKMDSKILDEKTLKILDHAVKLEIFNGDFYSKAAKIAKENSTKEMFKALSNIEMMHAKIHLRIGGFKEMPTLVNMNYDKYDNDNALLALANKREEHAVKFYEKYRNEINDKVIIRIFEALSNVEKEHILLTIR